MGVLREFLDWPQPALKSAADYLRRRFGASGRLDLSGVLVVVPGGRAGRRLLEILVALTEEQGLLLTPPAIVTPEKFPETLYAAKWPFADELTQRLAWVEALLAAKPQTLKAVLPKPPVKDDMPRWLAVGETLRRLHLELAADGLDCSGVLQGAARIDGFAEHDRWQALCELQRGYLNVLDGLKLWDVQTARLVAIQQREIQTDRQLVLIGTADLNRAQRQMLDQIADRVTALIVAPQSLADRFDEHGCLLPTKWTQAELGLNDEQIQRVDGPADQAQAVAHWLAGLDARYRADEITIGVPDERLVPQIERQLTQSGLCGRWAIGKQLAQTGPCRMLQAACDYAARRRFRDLAALVRHPDIYEWLVRELRDAKCECDVLRNLDEYAQHHFPAALDPERLTREGDASLRAICQAVERMVKPLAEKQRRLADWAQPLGEVLLAVYGTRQLDREDAVGRYLAAALKSLREALDGLARVPEALQPVLDARQVCRMVLAELAGQSVPPAANLEAIELLGWLDLPLDDAPATLVTTFNEGFIPESITADAFLPNRLREALGLLHNDRRLARDAYALSVLCASRKALCLVVARRDTEGNPLPPSRLLFLTDTERLVRRGRKFFGEPPPQPPRRNMLTPAGGSLPKSLLAPPRPTKLPKRITELSVTSFRDYIACPYRFYLRYQLRLLPVADDAAELDGAAFGGLVHWVLEQFGRTDDALAVRQSVDAARIAEYLDDKLAQITAARFGSKLARPAVLVQVEQMRLRLRAFAAWQAARTHEGWRIVLCENSQSEEKLAAAFSVDGEDFKLTGRIDRVDYHDRQRRLTVLDYKTADRGDDPKRTHRCHDEWIDLQLPLYRHLVRQARLEQCVAADAPIDLGYIVLPVDLKCVGLKLADWDDALLLSADLKAQDVIRGLWAQRFWPPTSPPPSFCDDVAVICQDRALGGGICPEDEAA